LTRRFYRRDPVTLARALLGQVLVRRLPDGRKLAGRIVEVEAYLGVEDRAAHSFGGRRTARNASMWGDAGHAYVYFTYGMHWCMNVVADRREVPTACLIRALEPLLGIEEMKKRRQREQIIDLCSGPAKLTEALGIDGALDGVDLVEGKDGLFIVRGKRPGEPIAASPRVGVAYAMEWARKPLRFFLEGNAHVSGRKKFEGAVPPKKRRPLSRGEKSTD
jgi:DNA-3-methyladenine glycosylase